MVDPAKRRWLLGGVLFLVPLSGLMLFSDSEQSAWFPVTLHGFVLWHTVSYGYLLAIPAAYSGSLLALWGSKYFGQIVTTLVVVVGTLTTIWFIAGWDLGIRYQGVSFARGVLLTNLVMLTLALALSVAGAKWKSKHVNAAAHLVIFTHLAWCGFPWLGGF